VKEGAKIVSLMTLPGVNMVLADTKGNIAYAYAGLVPKRDPLQNPYLPLDGRLSSSLWTKFLDQGVPIVVNPPSGFIVTANQNIFEHDTGDIFGFGNQGAAPYRALRIQKRIEDMLKKHSTIDFNEISSVQLDETSVEAQELAPLVGAICVDRFNNADDKRKRFAQEIVNFRGHYTTDSLGAFPYELLMQEIVSRKLKDALVNKMPDIMTYTSHAYFLVKNALLKELQGQPTAIFTALKKKHGNLTTFIGESCEEAFQNMALWPASFLRTPKPVS
jgi:acyl-homoserine lactone acylase PvdQ